MEEEHAHPETVHRLLRRSGSSADLHTLVQHLLERCPRCTAALREVVYGRHPVSAAREPTTRLHPAVYEEAFRRVLESTDRLESRLAREKAVAPALWAQLAPLPQGRRLLRVRNDRRFQTWGLFDYLLETSRDLSRGGLEIAAEAAQLALAVAETLPIEEFGGELLADFRTAAWRAIGECRRRMGDLDGADEALGRAWRDLRHGTGDPLEEARLAEAESHLRSELGDLETAARLRSRAEALDSEAQSFPETETAPMLVPVG
jgi:hypothetical protein